MTDRQKWAMERNWLLFRLRGMKSVLGKGRIIMSFLSEYLSTVESIDACIDLLIIKVSESKYEEV